MADPLFPFDDSIDEDRLPEIPRLSGEIEYLPLINISPTVVNLVAKYLNDVLGFNVDPESVQVVVDYAMRDKVKNGKHKESYELSVLRFDDRGADKRVVFLYRTASSKENWQPSNYVIHVVDDLETIALCDWARDADTGKLLGLRVKIHGALRDHDNGTRWEYLPPF